MQRTVELIWRAFCHAQIFGSDRFQTNLYLGLPRAEAQTQAGSL